MVVGAFLSCAQALDITMIPVLNSIALQQSQPTKKVMDKVQQLLDYANTYQNIFVQFYASDMQLHVDSDATFLVLPKACSCIAGYFQLLNNKGKDDFVDNGPILIEYCTVRSVVTFVAEIETHGVFQNAKKIIL